ncbi:DUF397 domain-containing protein [Nocardia sp. NPDC059764]|uniref:DUF397 domain-containing protein n=1 Tax=Nocardia sp. NPDC059764 TaxID=3346939 RepID=UPI003649F076
MVLPQGLKWFKSSRSGSEGECVEAAFLDDGQVAIRDSKDRRGPTLVFTPAQWDVFTVSVRRGAFDRG